LASANPSKAGADLNGWGSSVHALSSRLILEKQPVPGTLQVTLAGRRLPREQVTVDGASNELGFREGVSPAPAPGDEIDVSYEASDD
jgi:hypothetical protein